MSLTAYCTETIYWEERGKELINLGKKEYISIYILSMWEREFSTIPSRALREVLTPP